MNIDLFTYEIDLDFLINVAKDCIKFLIWQPGFCLIFMFSKEKKKTVHSTVHSTGRLHLVLDIRLTLAKI